MTVAEIIYVLCAATSLAAAWLLIRYYRERRTPLLFWSSLGFAGLALHNVLVYVDRALLPDANISLLRSVAGTAALLVILYGLIEDARAS